MYIGGGNSLQYLYRGSVFYAVTGSPLECTDMRPSRGGLAGQIAPRRPGIIQDIPGTYCVDISHRDTPRGLFWFRSLIILLFYLQNGVENVKYLM